MNITICAIIVTKDRKNLLIDCLNGVLSQTLKVDSIILIDNNSNDDTRDFLTLNKILTNKSYGIINEVKIIYKKLEKNLGSAGGYYEGLKLALESDCNWFWLLDDDVEPIPNALENIVKYISISDLINVSKTDIIGKRISWQGYIDEASGFIIQYEDEFYKNKDWCVVNYACFEGMLISRKLIDKIGLPKKEFFFVGDDIYYGYLASKYTNVIYIKDICLIKKIQSNIQTDLKLYLYFRNVIGYTYRKISRKKIFYLFRLISSWTHFTIILLKDFRFNGVLFMNKGLIDGFREKFLNKFN